MLNEDGTVNDNPDYTKCCSDGLIRGASISGADPYAPWYDLGSDTGLKDWGDKGGYICEDDNGQELCLYTYIDNNVIDGFEYTYSVTSYDMGVSGASQTLGADGTLSTTYIANPDEWANPKGYQSIETSRGTTVYDPNFVIIVPGYKSDNDPSEESLKEIKVVPNPYVAASNFKETAYLKKLLFTHLPAQCTINIYTVTGEMVTSLDHDDVNDGSKEWDLRTINNQEVSPGLYIYTVESTDSNNNPIKHVGKFAIIR